jgi:hypothetical protein
MLLLFLAGCVETDSAALRLDPDTLHLLKQEHAQCRAQCRAEEAACTVDDGTDAPSCPRQHLACHVRCPPVSPGQQTPPVGPSAEQNL